jgi:hypothetical protein
MLQEKGHTTGAGGTMSGDRAKPALLLGAGVAVVIAIAAALCIGAIVSDDPVSRGIRAVAERALADRVEHLMSRAEEGRLRWIDRCMLRTGLFVGAALCRGSYPEAAAVLRHAVRGGGADLELPAAYFSRSEYLRQQIERLGPGVHGPIALDQRQDWRLSVAVNPYYLKIERGKVILYHPRVAFAAVGTPRVRTMVPLGKMKVRVYDNLVSALGARPFRVYSEWDVAP